MVAFYLKFSFLGATEMGGEKIFILRDDVPLVPKRLINIDSIQA